MAEIYINGVSCFYFQTKTHSCLLHQGIKSLVWTMPKTLPCIKTNYYRYIEPRMSCLKLPWAKDGLPKYDEPGMNCLDQMLGRSYITNLVTVNTVNWNKASSSGLMKDGFGAALNQTPPSFILFLSDFKVAAVTCCCSPFGGYDHTTPTIYHVCKTVDRRSKMIEGKSVKTSPRIHASHFWARNIWTAAISLFWWIQSSSFRLKELRTLRTTGMKSFTNSFMHFIASFAISISRFPCVQEATTASSWSPHCMEMARFMHIRL